MQYSYFNGHPEWITIQKNDLKLFLSYIYYGNLSLSNAIENNNYEDDNNSEEIFKLYKHEILKNILKIYKVIEDKFIKPVNKIDVGVTMIHNICKTSVKPAKDIHNYVLNRLKLIDNKRIFIYFQNNRTYTAVDQYIENNNLTEGFLLYPKSLFYDVSNYNTGFQNIRTNLKNS